MTDLVTLSPASTNTACGAPLPDRVATALSRPAAQQPAWPDPAHAAAVTRFLRELPPLVSPSEIDRLTGRLATVARGDALILQGGDCAETFGANNGPHVRSTVSLLRRMAATLSAGTGWPVVTVGRLAGQYAKPRSAPLDALGLPAYRGDIVNSPAATPEDRRADPNRMLRAYLHARTTRATVRTACAHPDEIWTSHEALLLDYESAQLHRGITGGEERLYAGSAHFLWIGERTRQPDGAHLALAELIANPVGVKLGPGTTPAQAAQYVERLDPRHRPGRVTLISRMGRERVRDVLPAIVERVAATGHEVVWQCDPMHGNTRESRQGYKTRDFAAVVDELEGYFAVHRALGTHPGGVHLECTGEAVTECVGGNCAVDEDDLPRDYRSACDPRLNASQSVELAERMASMLGHRP